MIAAGLCSFSLGFSVRSIFLLALGFRGGRCSRRLPLDRARDSRYAGLLHDVGQFMRQEASTLPRLRSKPTRAEHQVVPDRVRLRTCLLRRALGSPTGMHLHAAEVCLRRLSMFSRTLDSNGAPGDELACPTLAGGVSPPPKKRWMGVGETSDRSCELVWPGRRADLPPVRMNPLGC